MTYNGRDDRVTMRKSGITRWFVYDADGRVLGEYGASAADVRAEFIWALPEVGNDNTPFGGDDGAGGYMPLAVATPDTGGTVVVNWVHGNHLGVPLVTTDATGAAATTPNDYLVPGYPGQSRVVADLYYNRHRDYDPSTGRYIQADPIGLEGGQNPFAYAGNNPMRFTDPMGLCVEDLCIGEGALSLRLYCMRFPARCAGAAAAVGGAITNLFRGPPRNPPIPPAIPGNPSCDPDDDDPCEVQYEIDYGRCTSARIRYGKAGFAQCASSALRRRSQCKKGQQLEPLTGVDRPLYRN